MGKSLAAFLFALSATVSPTTPREVVQATVTRVLSVLEGVEADRADRVEPRTTSSEVTRARVRRVAAGLFDFDEMARRTLGRHWAARSRAEQTEFVTLLTDLFERSYIGKLEAYAGERVTYVGETVDGPFAFVRSKIVGSHTGRDTPVDYRLHQRDGQWRVYDVVVDGVGFVTISRAEFNRVIVKSSYRGLAEALRKGQVQVRTDSRRS